MAFIPHTDEDIRSMLRAIGAPSVEALFDEIPANLRAKELEKIPPALNEMSIGRLMQARAAQDGRLLNFIGAGAYEHHIPAAVWSIITRGEIYSAYTPYQAEASQGTLQTIYEFQTMIASLTGMDVSNASMYDGASALAEACLMAVRAHRTSKSMRILMPANVHPIYRSCVAAITESQHIKLETIAVERDSGRVDRQALQAHAGSDVTALVIAQPNFFGVLDEVDALVDWAHAQNIMVIAIVNPMSLSILKPPGRWGTKGADIVVGEGQPLGVPLASGGPYFGFMTTRQEYVRQMPGRIVGRTVDLDGKSGFALTLQAREQHIRRGKATSNICTNQGLLMSAATIYLSILGPEGLARVAKHSLANANALRQRLATIGIKPVFNATHFHECLYRLPVPASKLIASMAQSGIAAGFDVASVAPEWSNTLLVATTETKTDEDLDQYVQVLAQSLQSMGV